MSFYSTVLSAIDLRSFSNVWFWIAVAVAWSNVTHYVVGVPFDLVLRARRNGGQDMADLEAFAAAQFRRRASVIAESGVWLVGIWAAILSAMLVLAIRFQFELAQALALMLVPLSLVAVLGMRFAQRHAANPPTGHALTKALTRFRFGMQFIGLIAIFATTMWGMWYNMALRPFVG